MNGVRILDFTPRLSGALRGFLDAEFPFGLVFHECGVFELNGKWWAAPASKAQISRDGMVLKEVNGKTRLRAGRHVRRQTRRDLWSNTVIAALRDARPEIFE